MLNKLLVVLVLLATIVFTNLAQVSPKTDSIPRITIEELKAKIDKNERVVVVDVRAYIKSKIKGAVNIPYAELEKNLNKLPKDSLIVTVCACYNEGTSGQAVKLLKGKGYDQVVALKGGQMAWETAQYPTEVVKEESTVQQSEAR